LVLHASLREDGLEVWAESPVGETPPARLRRRGRVPRSPGSPYDPPAEALLAALTAAGLGGELETHPAVAWLPTVDGAPIASSPLIAEPPASKALPTLAPWTMTACRLAAAPAIDLLCACIDHSALAAGVFVGRDLAFASAALRHAAALVARQRYVPSLEQRDGIHRAVWLPLSEGPDAERFAGLARAMPGASLAVGSP